MGSQMSGYCYATEVERGTPCPGAYINAIEVSKLPDAGRKCSKHKVDYGECRLQHTEYNIFYTARTPEQVANWLGMASNLAQKARFYGEQYGSLEALRYATREGQFVYKACSGCQFKEWCRMDFKADMAGEFTVWEPWEPWENGGEK